MSIYKIQVKVVDTDTGDWVWKFGRRSTGEQYTYPTREQAEQSLRFWEASNLCPEHCRVVEVDT